MWYLQTNHDMNKRYSVAKAIELGWLVPVEPCEHGNYAKHAVINASYEPAERSATKWDIGWCEGAALRKEGD